MSFDMVDYVLKDFIVHFGEDYKLEKGVDGS